MRKTKTPTLIFLILCIASSLAAGDTRQIVLTEHLGLSWVDEVVSYPLEFEKGLCVAASLKLDGSGGEQACQLSDVTLFPGGEFVRSATLSFLVAKLEPGTTLRYTLNYGAKPATSKGKSDLQLSSKNGQAEAASATFGVRLTVGERSYDPPVPAEKAPPPVVGMRLADGSWFGGGRMFGPTPIASYSASIIDSGPVFVRACCTYTYLDGNTLEVRTRLDARGRGLGFETAVAENKPEDGWDLLLSKGLPALTLQFPKEAAGKQGGVTPIAGTNWLQRPVAAYPAGTITNLSPWGDWWDEFTQPDVYLQFADGKRELVLLRHQPDRWVLPVEGGEAAFGHFSSKLLPLVKGGDGALSLRVNNAAGARIWSLGEGDDPQGKLAVYPALKGPASGPPLGLDAVKDMVLEWPDAAEKHPWLMMDAAQVARVVETDPKALDGLTSERAIKSLEGALGRFGEFDLMRQIGNMSGQYDIIIDSDRITPEQRKRWRARMAYLAYYAASAANWSPARGYRSGNPNMTITHVLNQGILACLLKDHPMAREWAELPSRQMHQWLDETLDDDGYWNESSHYARVSVSKLMAYAIVAQRAGFGDFLSNEKFKKMGMLYERLLTPPDPQRELPLRAPRGEPKPDGPGLFPRVSAPHGRGERGDRWGMGGLLAKAYRKLDPEYSATMQWSWQQTGLTYIMGEGIGGLERLYTDPGLPARAPVWESESIRRLGYLLRSGTGTEAENFLLFISQFATNPDGEIWPSETGAISKWFARGVPMGGEFNGYPYSNLHSLLLNRVMPAASHKPGGTPPPTGFTGTASQDAFAALPRLDYASAGFELTGAWSRVFSLPPTTPAFPSTPKSGGLPMHWQRQLISVKDDAPDGVGYLILRDTVLGGQPSQWHFWTLSEKVGAASQVAERAKFLADAPGDKIAARSLLKGDRFTALGQFGMDLEYYIASPSGTPRHTLRYGLNPQAADVPKFSEYQDLLQLTLPGDGSYFVALFPRKPDEEVPRFVTSGGGRVISIKAKWGIDHVFLCKNHSEAKGAEYAFVGTAASIQNRGAGSLLLALGAEGTVATKGFSLTAPFGASLHAGEEKLSIDLPADHPPGEIVVAAPGRWELRSGGGVTVSEDKPGKIRLGIPSGAVRVEMLKAK